MTKTTYSVLEEGFLLGTYYRVGEKITLTEAQARMFVREGRIEAVKPGTPAAAKPKAKPSSALTPPEAA